MGGYLGWEGGFVGMDGTEMMFVLLSGSKHGSAVLTHPTSGCVRSGGTAAAVVGREAVHHSRSALALALACPRVLEPDLHREQNKDFVVMVNVKSS